MTCTVPFSAEASGEIAQSKRSNHRVMTTAFCLSEPDVGWEVFPTLSNALVQERFENVILAHEIPEMRTLIRPVQRRYCHGYRK